MKSLIVYDSKSGTTEDCALEIKNSLGSDLLSLSGKTKLKLDDYDLTIIGTPLYMGHPLRTIKKFCRVNSDLLLGKKLAFYLCGIGNPSEMIEAFKKVIPIELTNRAEIISHFGGELRTEGAGFFKKMIIKKLSETKELKLGIKHEEINIFIKSLKGVK